MMGKVDFLGIIKSALLFLERVLIPPLCLNCQKPVETDQTLCAECWKKIRFIAPPFCACCGMPFETPMDVNALCGECLDSAPAFSKARAVVVYDDASRDLMVRFKFSDRMHLAPMMARLMATAGAELLDDAVIVPVPLHRWRLLRRRYNQAAVLGMALARLVNRPIFVDALLREKATSPQSGLKREEREKNVKNAFAINPRVKGAIEGKSVVLVDDVSTTGATANACARVLLAAGARDVRLLTMAKTVKG